MSLSIEQTAEIISKFGASNNDSGCTEVQVALLTKRLELLSSHLRENKKDHHSRLGLMKLVGQRRRLLRYLNRKSPESYKKLIGELGLRK